MQTAKRNPAPLLLQATFRDGEPVRPRSVLGEALPHHADMLRYDLGFHSPGDTSLVIFPAFRHKSEGNYPTLTPRRWQSFGIRLTPKDENESYNYISEQPVGDWIGYRHPENEQGQTDYGTLAPVTLSQWLKDHPKVIISGWRS